MTRLEILLCISIILQLVMIVQNRKKTVINKFVRNVVRR